MAVVMVVAAIVVARCLRVDPGERYRSAAEVGAALARLEDRVPRKPAMLDWLTGLKGGDERGTGEAAETLDLDTAENNATVTERVEPSVGLRRSNLPLEPNIFVGRTGELTELSRLLEEGHRFVTVLGPPGTGKTRLTQRFGSQWLEAGQCESAWFCDLSEAKTGMGVLRAVASALDVPLKDGGVDETTLAQRLGHVIAGRGVTLLLIDNAEQVVEKVARWVRLTWSPLGIDHCAITAASQMGHVKNCWQSSNSERYAIFRILFKRKRTASFINIW